MPSAEAPTSGRVISKVASAFERAGSTRRSALARAALQLLVAAQQVVHRHAAVLEDELAGLRGADAELRLLLAHRETEGVLGTTNDAWPRWPRSLSTVATTTVVGDAAVRDEALVPFRTHSSPSSTAVVRGERTSDPALGSVTA